MYRLVRRFRTAVLVTLAIFIVLAAVLVSVFRVLAPQVPEYRAQIEQVASEAVGQPVTVGDIDARWQGLGPEVRLLDVRLGESDGEQLELGEVRVRFGLPHLIRQQALRPDRISVLRSRLYVLQDDTGQWHLRGLDPAAMDAGEAASGQRPWEAIVPLLEDFGRLALRDSTIVMRSPLTGDALLEFTDINLVLGSTGTRHLLEAEAGLPGIFGRSLVLELDATGPLAEPGRWDGDLYINGRGLRPGDFFAEYLGEGIELGETRADIELWSHWQGGDPRDITLDYQAEQVGLPARRGYPAAMLDEFSGRVVWRQLRQGWRADVSRLGLSLDGRAWPGDSLSVEVSQGSDGRVRSLSGLLDYLDLEDVHRLLVALPDGVLDENLLARLDDYGPEGEIHRVAMDISLPDGDELPQISLDARLVGVGWQGKQMIPGVRGIDAGLRVRDTSASLDLDSTQLVLDYPAVFAAGWLPARVRGQLGLHHADNGWVIDGQQIDFVHPHGRVAGRFAVELPEDGPPHLDISGDFEGLQVAATGAYLPRNVMPETVVSWLEQALLDGEVTRGSVVLRGRSDEFPFDEPDHDGLFRVSGEISGVWLDFDPDWPDLLELEGALLFEGAGMRISARSGTLQGANLQSVVAEIPDLAAGELAIQGVAEAGGDSLAGLLRNSPLGGAPGHVAQGLSGGGPAELGLSLDIPLTRAEDTQVNGVLRWHDASLSHDFWPASLDQINGELHFSNDRLYAREISATMLGDPVTLNIDHVARADGSYNNVVEAGGTASARALSMLARAPEPSPFSGQAQWNARVDVPPGDSDESLVWRLTSSLHGLAVDMAEPLAKAADERRVVRIFGEVCCEGQRNMDIRYGDVARAQLRFESDPGEPVYLRRGLIAIGVDDAGLPEADGVHIHARMPTLDPEDIRAWIPGAEAPAVTELSIIEALPDWLATLYLELGTLYWADSEIEQVLLRLQREVDGAASVSVSTAMFSGQARLPADLRQGVWQLDLDRVNLLPREEGERGWLENIDPRILPPVDLAVADVQFGEWPLGRLEARLRPLDDGVRFDQATMTSDDLRVRAEGDWRRDENGADQSDFRINMRSSAPDVTARRLGYEPLLEARRAVLELDLAWPGNPAAISLAGASGSARLRVRDGALVNVEPGAGRFFGLVSIYALPRRLSLDFGDVIGAGMAFDSIDGNFDIGNGQAYTGDLEISGPSAEVRVSGRTGLVERDLDQRVEVTPSVSSGVALAGTVAGGPVVGAALFVMQEMFQRPLGQITRTRYHIQGSWDDPAVERVEEGLAAAPVRPDDDTDSD